MGPIIHLYTILGEPPCWGPRAELTIGHLEVTVLGVCGGALIFGDPLPPPPPPVAEGHLCLRSQDIVVLGTPGYLPGDRPSLS